MQQGSAAKINPEIELIGDIAGFVHDPLGYVLYAFPWGSGPLSGHDGPDTWQRERLVEIGQGIASGSPAQIAVASGHGVGKSSLVAWLILWAISTFEGTRGVVTANTEAQLRTKTWPELTKWHRLAINRHWFKITATSIFSAEQSHERNWRIDAIPWSERNTEAFAGLHNEGRRAVLLFDEASAIPDAIWEVSEGATMDHNTEVLWAVFGNPTRNTGRFRECFRKFKHRWLTSQVDSRDCKLSNKERIAGWVKDYGIDSDFVKVRVRGMFPALSVLQFISTADADAALGKALNPAQYSFAPKILTLDNAWQGDDEGVIALRQGLAFRILRVFAKNDNDMQVATMLANCEDQEGVDAVFIDMGYGTGVYSAGKTWGRNTWRLVNFAERSTTPGCLNKRAEMWTLMRSWLKEGGAIPDDKALHQELTSIETVPRGDGVIQLESKIDLKRRGYPSPGRADALALTFAFPVMARRRPSAVGGGREQAAESWDPLEG